MQKYLKTQSEYLWKIMDHLLIGFRFLITELKVSFTFIVNKTSLAGSLKPPHNMLKVATQLLFSALICYYEYVYISQGDLRNIFKV